MKETIKGEYEIDADYTTTKLRAITAILKTLYEIEIKDFNGEVTIWKEGVKEATLKISDITDGHRPEPMSQAEKDYYEKL